MADRTYRSLTLVEQAIPPEVRAVQRWQGVSGTTELTLELNQDSGVFTAVARVTGKPFSAAAESTDPNAACDAALTALVDGAAARGSPRAREVSRAERDEAEALRTRT